MKNKLLNLITLSMVFSLSAQADLKSDFKAGAQGEKGPFGLNYIQGVDARTTVLSGAFPNKVLFQAAYRSDEAKALADTQGIFLGNLFTTNYYELMGEFVFGDARSNHELNHSGLLAQASLAMPKATVMVQNWVLEKHYISQFHDSRLARGFKLRGISGSEFELEYANYFFNFYLSSMNGDFQYLPAFLLAGVSPINNSSSLEKARTIIANIYDTFNLRFGTNDPRVKPLYRLRNAIHNQLSPAVIDQINAYLKDFPYYLEEGNDQLLVVRDILISYYSFNSSKLAKQAEALEIANIKNCADKITSEGPTAENLLALSRAAAEWRSDIGTEKAPYNKKAQILALLSNVTNLLNKEITNKKEIRSPLITEAIINAIYIEGFLIKDNWDYFKTEANTSSDPAALLADVIDIGGEATLTEAFAPVLNKWISIEPKMQYFLDNTIKSSALNTAAQTIEKLRR